MFRQQMCKFNHLHARAFNSATMRKHAQPVETTVKHVQAKIAHIDAHKPFSVHLTDSYQRKHDYLRISLTERCNLRCFYCMPSEGIELTPRPNLLTNEEIVRLSKLFVENGVTKIRLTGGEPTVRKDVLDIIAHLHTLRGYGLESIAMTSNGLALHRRLPQFIENGLTHLNLSLDTLDPFKFEIMTRRPGHDAVLKTLDVALTSTLKSVKLNVVVVKGLNDSEVFDFIEMTRDKRLSIRFIEFMPFTGNAWNKEKMVPSSELLAWIKERYPSVCRMSDEANDTARSWTIPGYRGSFGFISSMSDHFCATCNRLRITADGKIKVCLFDAKEISLRDEVRNGATDSQLLKIIGMAVRGKQERHVAMEDIDVVNNRPMILIDRRSRDYSAPDLLPTSVAKSLLKTHRSRIQRLNMPLLRHISSSARWSQKARLTHVDEHGRASMVNVNDKSVTIRSATASGRIFIPEVAYKLITSPADEQDDEKDTALAEAKQRAKAKGDVLTVSQLAAIMACKRTSDLIPLCHPLPLSHVSVTLDPEVLPPYSTGGGQDGTRFSVLCCATVTCEGKTGVEMEALTAVSVGLLTVWDMLKAVAGKEMVISDIIVTEKKGGKSGDFIRPKV